MDASLPPPSDRKADRILSHCVYRIATGKWRANDRLPSVREAERLWGVDRRTVLDAYRQLEAQGLARCVDRSGYYLTAGPELGRLAQHRETLERIFESTRDAVLAETGLSPLGAFRYLAHLASIRAGEQPECAFVECTRAQAVEHAREVSTRLGVPCLALTMTDLDPIPDHVRNLLTSGFHLGELQALGSDRRQVTAVPIEVSRDIAVELPDNVREGIVLESDAEDAHDILSDVRETGIALPLALRMVDDVDSALVELDREGFGNRLALLSPRLWGNLDERWRRRPEVRQIAFRIRDDAWPGVAQTLGLPLGTLG